MTDLFVTLLNLSITASWLVLAVVAVRLIFKKAPKKIMCMLWALVALRLIFPFSIESALSLIPSRETVSTRDVMETPDTWTAPEYVIDSGFEFVDDAVNPIVNRVNDFDTAKASHRHVDRMQTLLSVSSIIWICGVAAMLLYSAISFLRLKRRVREAVPIEKGVRRGGSVKSPFILGVFRPKIYIPADMDGETLDYALMHERAHIKRGDHFIKPFAFMLLSVYWINPLLWLAYVLLCRDIEAACDECVLKSMDETRRKGYASALLDCAADRKSIAACPVAFGETNVKQRIKGALSYRKPALWIIIAAVVISAVLAVVFLTDPIRKNNEPQSYSDLEGVSLYVIDADVADGAVTLTLEWFNNSKDDIQFGEPFDVLKKNKNGEWKSCAKEELAFVLPAYPLETGKKATITRDLSMFDLSIPGQYRFATDFDSRSYGDHFDIKHTAWVAFTVLPDGGITYEKADASTAQEMYVTSFMQYLSKRLYQSTDIVVPTSFYEKYGPYRDCDPQAIESNYDFFNVTPAALTATGTDAQVLSNAGGNRTYLFMDGEKASIIKDGSVYAPRRQRYIRIAS